MASAEKTGYLSLSKWAGTDRPQREDFCSDNEKIDAAFESHVTDSTVHVTGQMAEKLRSPFVLEEYAGDGSALRSFQFDFEPSLVFIFPEGRPLSFFNGTGQRMYAAAGIQGSYSLGLFVGGKKVEVTNTSVLAENGYARLNETGQTYNIVAFK